MCVWSPRFMQRVVLAFRLRLIRAWSRLIWPHARLGRSPQQLLNASLMRPLTPGRFDRRLALGFFVQCA